MGHVNRDCPSPKPISSNETPPEANSDQNKSKIEKGTYHLFVFTLIILGKIQTKNDNEAKFLPELIVALSRERVLSPGT